MSQPKSIQITIPDPCTQSWDEMTVCGDGRFCNHCQKTVIDFTNWSDTALYNFFAKKPDNICGRFCSHQMDRPINIPYQPHSRLYRLTIALGLTLMVAPVLHAAAQNNAPRTEQNVYKRASDRAPANVADTSGSISGTVIDEKKEPMINATIQIFQNSVLKGGSVTDYDGNYIVKPLAPGTYDALVLYAGYDSLIMSNIVVENTEIKANFSLEKPASSRILSGAVVRYFYGKPLLDHDNPTKTIYTRDDLKHR